MAEDDNGVVLSKEQARRRRQRNIAIAFALVGLVVMFYLITVFRLGGEIANRPL